MLMIPAATTRHRNTEDPHESRFATVDRGYPHRDEDRYLYRQPACRSMELKSRRYYLCSWCLNS